MILVLAGRRVDAEGATEPRFPLRNVERVRSEIRLLLAKYRPNVVVASAAAGADLLALEEASAMGIETRVVLPFERERFKDASVTDRPGGWGKIFDKVYAAAENAGAVIIAPQGNANETDDEKYRQVTLLLFEQAFSLARRSRQSTTTKQPQVMAVAIWNGSSRGLDDITALFINEAHERGVNVEEISTR